MWFAYKKKKKEYTKRPMRKNMRATWLCVGYVSGGKRMRIPLN